MSTEPDKTPIEREPQWTARPDPMEPAPKPEPEPDQEPSDEQLSDCCGAAAYDEIDEYGFGMCMLCKDHAHFSSEEEEIEWVRQHEQQLAEWKKNQEAMEQANETDIWRG